MDKNVARYRRMVTKINKLEKKTENLNDSDFAAKTSLLKLRAEKGETLEQILPEAFALVREAAKRKLKLRAFNVQLQGAIAAHEGKIVEMKTGEGKTLTIIFPAFLNALEGKGVHVVTANDYLAQRDAQWMNSVYQMLGLSVGAVTSQTDEFERQVSYGADITYVTNNEVGFDFLKDNMLYDERNKRQRELHYAIVDEADSVLIDEAQIPLVISENNQAERTDEELYLKLNPLIEKLKNEIDYKIDQKEHTVNLTIAGIKKLETLLGVHNLYQDDQVDYIYYISRLLKAHKLFQKDQEYIVENNQVVIVDEFTGRLMQNHRYYQGIHQAIEAKEGLKIQGESQTLASITFQHLFKRYQKLAGLTGTAQTAKKEFRLVYGKEVVVIPTNKKVIRRDKSDKFFLTWNDKVKYLAWSAQEHYFKKRAMLIGTRSIERSNLVGGALMSENIASNVLNAKHTGREAEIIAGAGQPQTVTVATNMAGRGTDIELENSVRGKGGLVVFGTERHNARRIDNQLIGRAGRQGDPGETRFLISAEDQLIKTYYQQRYVAELKKNKGWPEGAKSKRLEKITNRAQQRMESVFFDQRILSYEFDKILDVQRKSFYRQRDRILKDDSLKEETLQLIKNEIYRIVISKQTTRNGKIKINQTQEIAAELKRIIINDWFSISFVNKDQREFSIDEVRKLVYQNIVKYYEDFEDYISAKKLRTMEKVITLKVLDLLWIGHLRKVEEIQEAALINSINRADFFEEYEIQMAAAYRALLLSAPKVIAMTLFRTMNRTLAETEKNEKQKVIG